MKSVLPVVEPDAGLKFTVQQILKGPRAKNAVFEPKSLGFHSRSLNFKDIANPRPGRDSAQKNRISGVWIHVYQRWF